MKLKASEVKKNYWVVCLGYCQAQGLLEYKRRLGYTAGVNGWNSDIYLFQELNAVISTGYRPINGISPSRELVEKYVKQFNDFKANNSDYDDRVEKAKELLTALVREVLKNEKTKIKQ